MPQATYDTYSRLSNATPAIAARATTPRTDPCADPRPACPTCGGLQCLCRPRFFPGQLLTDADLNLLQKYVIEKNRLHNRSLHGWGVACGLEVVCDPCSSRNVVVRAGHALAPCGDDIVVCGDTTVDVCALIDACRPATTAACESPYSAVPRDCRSGPQRWVLAICYDERPTRGMTAQLGAGDTSCGKRCSCGGSGACGCGGNAVATSCSNCGGSSAGGGCGCNGSSTSRGAARRAYQPQCEPTQMCEGYRFIAYPAPAAYTGLPPFNPRDPNAGQSSLPAGFFAWLYANRKQFGPLIERVLCCMTQALQLRAELVEGRLNNDGSALDAVANYAQAVREFAASFAVHRCSFVSKVDTIANGARDAISRLRSVQPLTPAARGELDTHYWAVQNVWFEILSECFCSALLPPCPEPAVSNCVPLAVVTVASAGNDSSCRIGEICNWEERKLLITWRTIGYWFSWLPWQALRAQLANLCCGSSRGGSTFFALLVLVGLIVDRLSPNASPTVAHLPNPGTTGTGVPVGASAAPAAAFAAARVRDASAPSTTTSASTPATGASSATDPIAAALASNNLFFHLAGDFQKLRSRADAEAGPLAALAPFWSKLAARLSDASALDPLGNVADSAAPADVAALLTRVDELQRRVDAQGVLIDRLKK